MTAEPPPITPDGIMQSGLHPRGARDFFDALVALGMLECLAGPDSMVVGIK